MRVSGEGGGKDRRNGTGAGFVLQGNHAVVILYGENGWVVTGSMLKVLEVFHHQAAIRILEMMVQCTMSREWEWPLVADALETSGLFTIKYYIQHSQATIAEQMV